MNYPNYEKISEFWSEVAGSIGHLLDETDEFDVLDVMQHYEDSLKIIDKNLTFHFERGGEDERVEMIFGCDGYAQSISTVLSLVGAAPAIDGVQIIAFNNRHDPLPTFVKVGEQEFCVEEFWYSCRVESGEFHLSVYVDDIDDDEENPAVEAMMVCLDATLGEFDLMTRVATLSWYPQPDEPEDYGLNRLTSLQQEFDAVRDQIRIIGVTLH